MTCPHCQKDIERCTHAPLHEEVRMLRLEADARKKIPGTEVIWIQSLVSHHSQKPRIDIQLGEIHTQLSVDAAMDVAKNIIECCAGSFADGFLFNFMQEKVGLDDGRAAQVLVDFRDYRMTLAEEFKKEQPKPDDE